MTRSAQMASVRQRNTAPELALRKALWRAGLRYRLHVPLPGSPDFILTTPRIAVFVDGCFWHGCPLHYSRPRTHPKFWADKLLANVERDFRVDTELKVLGWSVVHIWEHEIGEQASLDRLVSIFAAQKSPMPSPIAFGEKGSLWWRCICGSIDCQVQRIEGNGSLSPRAKVRPTAAELRCRDCGQILWHLVTDDSS